VRLDTRKVTFGIDIRENDTLESLMIRAISETFNKSDVSTDRGDEYHIFTTNNRVALLDIKSIHTLPRGSEIVLLEKVKVYPSYLPSFPANSFLSTS
jgi:hypothetical protein